tara:strand:+ start:24 stop:620 length:597 start_codon:yes stop_codon:yes gene_type:complete
MFGRVVIMGFFINKILKPIFLSQESNWIRRLDELTTGQLDVAHNGDGDGIAFAHALDGMVDIIENYDAILESVDQFYIKFDIKTAKPIHKIALKNPEKLSKKEMLEYFTHTSLIMANISRLHEAIPRKLLMYGPLSMHASHGFLMGAIGMICFPETRKKGFQLWKYSYECFPLCEKFKYKKHLPQELVKLLEVGVYDK